MYYQFYRHERALKYCERNIFALKAWYSALVLLLVLELIGVVVMAAPLAIFVRNLNMELVIAGILVNTMVVFPALLILVGLRSITVKYVYDIVVRFGGVPIVVLKDECKDGLKYEEVFELVCKLLESGQIKDSRIVGGGLLVKNGIELSDSEIKEYLGINNALKSKKPKSGLKRKDKMSEGVEPNLKKIVYDLRNVNEDAACDNCGKQFDGDDVFCGYCGTIRKSVRRRI